ncbi:MAG: FlgD immunoglobulin-like domain containing protein, partial [candidate division KSB1 bacterium]
LGFPFETISSALVRQAVLQRVLDFFFPPSNAVAEPSVHDLPQQFVLLQNYPNPFNPSTQFRFGLPERARVRLEIFDMLGRRVWREEEKTFAAGFHEAEWRGVEGSGKLAASGNYFLRMIAENARRERFVREIRFTLVK